MKKRLDKLCSLVDGDICADIGCDHGYLCEMLVEKGVKKIFACEVTTKNVNKAKANITNYINRFCQNVVIYEDKVTYDGGIYNQKGYGEAVQQNWDKCVDITKKSTNYGLKAGDSAPGIQYVTCPVCAIGGALGGGCYLIGDSIIDLFRRGQEVTFTKGTVFKTKLTQPIDVPVN